MDAKLEIMEVADSVNHFDRIPADILLAIVSRLENLKHMFQCSLVSKRFASAVYQIKAASLTVRSTERPSNAAADHIDELFPRLAGLTSAEATRFIQSSSIREMKFLSFLVNFRELRSISLEFTCPSLVCSSSLFKMRVKFSRRGAVVEKFVSIVANSVCMEAEQGRGYMGYQSPRTKSSISGTFLPLACCTNWLLALCLLLKCNPSLEAITITNGKKQGQLVLKGEELVAWRNSFVPGGLLQDFTPYASTRGWIVNLRIPESGYLLDGVDFVIARLGDDSDSESSAADEVDQNAMVWEYKGEERMLADALNEYLRRYGDAFIASELNY